MNIKKHIPNLFTLGNLFCGILATIFAVQGQFEMTAIFVVLGIVFDFFDGLVARFLHVQSKLGVQLDSLADMVSFGVVPGMVMFQLLNKSLSPQELGTGFETTEILKGFEFGMSFVPFIGMIIVLASAYRLAKFNIDIRQTENFIGLPTPANTLLIISLPLIFQYQYSPLIEHVIFNHWFLITLTIVSSFLLNAEIKLFSLKFKTWDFNSNQARYIFLALSLLAIIILKFIAIPLIIVLYILGSLLIKDK